MYTNFTPTKIMYNSSTQNTKFKFFENYILCTVAIFGHIELHTYFVEKLGNGNFLQ